MAASNIQLLATLHASFDASLHRMVGDSAQVAMAQAGNSEDSHEALSRAGRDQNGDATTAAALELIEEVRSVMER